MYPGNWMLLSSELTVFSITSTRIGGWSQRLCRERRVQW